MSKLSDSLNRILLSDLSQSAKVVGSYFYLTDRFEGNSPSYKDICEGVNCSKSTAIKSVKELVEKGYLIKIKNYEKLENVFYAPENLPENEKLIAS